LRPRQVGAFALAAVLFLTSLAAGRLISANPLVSPVPDATPSPTTQVTAIAQATATPKPTPTSTPTPPPPTPTVQERGTVFLDQDNTTAYRMPEGCLVHPLRLAMLGTELYVLDTGQLRHVSLGPEPMCRPVSPLGGTVDGVLVQEVADFAAAGDGASLLLLDRAGNVFRYLPRREEWRIERLADAPESRDSQYLISICAYQDEFCLLDTNVGEIWRHGEGAAEVLPTEVGLRESADLAVGENIFVLAQDTYRGTELLYKLSGKPLRADPLFSPPEDLVDPSLLLLQQEAAGLLGVIDRDGHRLRLLEPDSGELIRDYVFPDDERPILAADLRAGKLYLASLDTIYVYPQEPAGSGDWTLPTAPHEAAGSLPPQDSRVLETLPSLDLPLQGTVISGLSFRLPGAPRSYRYGVHEGIDFYWAAGQAVTTTTPVLSVAAGEVIRVDREYNPPSQSEMEGMLAEAARASYTSDAFLDILRGRQIWIDHGDSLVSRYCHLSSVADSLQVGDSVEQGQMIGYVGNTGTPASYYDQGSEMHLHLEIRIGNGYLGQYLRPLEVRRRLQSVFEENP
jgi:murein DD-endopeptidase MepM/ murein hydrolase activator NlpD